MARGYAVRLLMTRLLLSGGDKRGVVAGSTGQYINPSRLEAHLSTLLIQELLAHIKVGLQPDLEF